MSMPAAVPSSSSTQSGANIPRDTTPSPPPPYGGTGNNHIEAKDASAMSPQAREIEPAPQQEVVQQQTSETPKAPPAPAPQGRTPWFKKKMSVHVGQPSSSQSDNASSQDIKVNTGKPKDDLHTIVAMVIDRSGSMSTMRNEVHGGCNAFLEEQRKSDLEDKARSTVIFTRFDHSVEMVYNCVDLATMAPITAEDVQPRGSTALYDAIGETLLQTATAVNQLDTMPSVVIFILTDGAENASKSWNKSRITEQIKRLQGDDIKWDFYFAAANQDGMVTGSSLGMDHEQCTTYATESAKMTSAMRSSNMAYQRKKKCGIKGYTSMERAAMM